MLSSTQHKNVIITILSAPGWYIALCLGGVAPFGPHLNGCIYKYIWLQNGYQNSFLSGEPLRFFLTGMSAIDCSAVETKGTEVVTIPRPPGNMPSPFKMSSNTAKLRAMSLLDAALLEYTL